MSLIPIIVVLLVIFIEMGIFITVKMRYIPLFKRLNGYKGKST